MRTLKNQRTLKNHRVRTSKKPKYYIVTFQIIYMFKGSKKKHLDHYSFFYLGPQVIYILKDSKKNHLNDFFLVLFWGLALLGLHALITNLLSNKLFSCIPFLLECITFNGSNQKVSQFHFFPI